MQVLNLLEQMNVVINLKNAKSIFDKDYNIGITMINNYNFPFVSILSFLYKGTIFHIQTEDIFALINVL